MSTLNPSNDSVNSPPPAPPETSIGAVCLWLHAKGGTGELPDSVSKNWATALRSMAATLRPDEPDDCHYVLKQLDELARRWGNVNREMQGATARTYIGRARSALESYVSWLADPVGFRFKLKEREPKGASGSRRKPISPTEAATPQEPPKPVGNWRSFPLGDDREIAFRLPDGGIKVQDVARFMCHLLTYATDFDPTNPDGGSGIFAMVRRPS